MFAIKSYHKKIRNPFFIALLSTLFLFSCNREEDTDVQGENEGLLEEIRQEGILRAVVDYNSTNYFVYRGRPMGFSFELLRELSDELGVRLDITVVNDISASFQGLQEGRYDVVARNFAVTLERKEEVDFTVPIMYTRQVLVQREIGMGATDSSYIYSVLGLGGKQIHVQQNTSFHKRLLNLSEEIGEQIDIVEDSTLGVEQLIAQVANEEINYTVCDQNVGLLNKTYYPNIDVSLDVSLEQNIAWAVPKGEEAWKEYLNNWISDFRQSLTYAVLYDRYYESPRIVNRLNSGWHSISGGRISAFDPIIKRLAEENNWDWRLIAAVMYEESRFNPNAESWAGAQGLMQVLPETAEALGVENYTEPEQNIKAGIYMLNWLDEQLLESVPDSTERIKFTLAAYNVGLGHVRDAQRLAEKYGADNQVWDNNVDFYLKNKSAEIYFKDPVVEWGYCRGDEPYNYVHDVISNYMHYVNVIPE